MEKFLELPEEECMKYKAKQKEKEKEKEELVEREKKVKQKEKKKEEEELNLHQGKISFLHTYVQVGHTFVQAGHTYNVTEYFSVPFQMVYSFPQWYWFFFSTHRWYIIVFCTNINGTEYFSVPIELVQNSFLSKSR